MTDLTEENLDVLVAELNEPLAMIGGYAGDYPDEDEATNRMERAAAVITALRQREATAVAGAIEAASGIAMDFHVRALVWAKSVPGLDKHVGETDSYRIATCIRSLHTDATRAALDKVRADGMREAARLIPPAVSGAASIILAAADKLEGKP